MSSHGWWDLPYAPRWVCPECGELARPDDWEETEVSCEDCGTHPAIRCPACGEDYDHVWGADRVREATEARGILLPRAAQ